MAIERQAHPRDRCHRQGRADLHPRRLLAGGACGLQRSSPVPQSNHRAGIAPRSCRSIQDRATVEEAVDGVTHVLHLATGKETPETPSTSRSKACSGSSRRAVEPDVRALRPHRRRRRVGHFVVPPDPGDRDQMRLRTRVLRALQGPRGGHARAGLHPVRLGGHLPAGTVDQEKDDFRSGPRSGRTSSGALWREYVGAERADEYVRAGAAAHGRPRRTSGADATSCTSTIRRRHPHRARSSRRATADVQRLHGRARRLRGAGGYLEVPGHPDGR